LLEATPGSDTASLNDRKTAGASVFFLALVVLGIVRVLLGFITLPVALLPLANGILAGLFVAVPILALFYAASSNWTVKHALTYLAVGVALHAGFWAISKQLLGGHGVLGAVADAISQIGLPMWCAGLGALLVALVKDRNILVPIAIFLGFFDAFMVFSPFGVPNRILKVAPEVFENMASAVPAVSNHATGGKAEVVAYIGPADYVFLAMFFVALFRFHLRPAETLRWMIPTLVAYLFVVLIFKFPLPALIPIGAVVLAVNWREFRLTRDELVATGVAAALGAALFIWGMTVPPPKVQVVPSQPAPGPGSPKPQEKPEQERADQRLMALLT
jgi:hypothetical protein